MKDDLKKIQKITSQLIELQEKLKKSVEKVEKMKTLLKKFDKSKVGDITLKLDTTNNQYLEIDVSNSLSFEMTANVSLLPENFGESISKAISEVDWEKVGEGIGNNISNAIGEIKCKCDCKKNAKETNTRCKKKTNSECKKNNKDKNSECEDNDGEETLFEEIVETMAKEFLKPYLGTKPLATTISAAVQALMGNKAAQSALTLMFNPLITDVSKVLMPLLGTIGEVSLPLLSTVAQVFGPLILTGLTFEFGLNLGKESQDLLNNIEKFGKEEGRKVSGNSVMDKVALYKYDTEQANMSVQQGQIDLLGDFIASFPSKFSEWKNKMTYFQQEVDGVNNAINQSYIDMFADLGIQISTWWIEDVLPWFTIERWQELGNKIKKGITTKVEEFTTWWSETGISTWWTEKVLPWFTIERWQELGNKIKKGITTKVKEFITWWSETGISTWWNENVKPWFTIEKWMSLADGIKTGISNKWKEVVEWWNNKASLKAIGTTVSNFQSKVEDAWNDVKEWWKENASLSEIMAKIKLPHLTVEWETEGAAAKALKKLGLKGFPSFSVSYYATGGFPEDGWFRASHGEIMGRFDNGQSVVANNMQITEGIARGVRNANAEQNILLREQNALLRQILSKDNGISTRSIFEAVRTENRNYIHRNGQSAFV